jgi:hypothetical protein
VHDQETENGKNQTDRGTIIVRASIVDVLAVEFKAI